MTEENINEVPEKPLVLPTPEDVAREDLTMESLPGSESGVVNAIRALTAQIVALQQELRRIGDIIDRGSI